MDNSIDRLLATAQEKNSRVIYRFSPGLYMFADRDEDPQKNRLTKLAGYCTDTLTSIAANAPAVMFDFSAFAFYGAEGLLSLSMLLKIAKNLGYFVILDGCFAGDGALKMCEASFYADVNITSLKLPADAVTLSPYIPAEDMKAIAVLCREEDKAAFICAKSKKQAGKESFENIKTDGGLKLYEAAVDDAGAFGESYVGEKGYSVLGFMTAPVEKSSDLRDLDRWGIALVNAHPDDLDKAETYGFFYPKECEGEFVVITDTDIANKLGRADGNFGAEYAVPFFKECVEKVEKSRLEKK